jgi:hypothetical protein
MVRKSMGDYEKSMDKFVNPYYFIPLEKTCDKNHAWGVLRQAIENGDRDIKTGWLECELVTRTPVFIPNTTNDDAFGIKDGNGRKIKSYEFFSYENLEGKKQKQGSLPSEPIIPGSELRGMTRSVFETLTNSCMSALDDKKVLYKRVTSPAPDLGLITRDRKDKGWYFTPGEKVKIPMKTYLDQAKGFPEGQQVHFSCDQDGIINRISDREHLESEEGYIHHGELFGNKKTHESILVLDGRKRERVGEDAIQNLYENFVLYKDKTVNNHYKQGTHGGYNKVPLTTGDLLDLDNIIVYRAKHQGKSYLCPAQIGREVFYKKIKDVVMDYTPCDEQARLCPACSLFGFVTGERKEGKGQAGLGSRIRFCDASLKIGVGKPSYIGPIVLPELSSPKPSAVEFYLKPSKGADVWNYDYAFSRINKELVEVKEYRPAIKGRKFYWHHNKIVEPPLAPKESTSDRNVGARVLAKDNAFRFKVFFNSITTKELHQLAWVLELGGVASRAHKIGMGKPVGLGSVKISVKKVIIRTMGTKDGALEYKLAQDNALLENVRTMGEPWTLLGCSRVNFEDMCRGLDFDSAPANVAYPTNVGGKAIYEWFVANRNAEHGTGTNPVINQWLPEGTKAPSLLKYKRKEKTGGKQNF